MRTRTLLTLASGAAAGAGVMYLLDPDHGPLRRRQARRAALAQGREAVRRAAVDARRTAHEVAVAAVAGYQDARAGAQDHDRHP